MKSNALKNNNIIYLNNDSYLSAHKELVSPSNDSIRPPCPAPLIDQVQDHLQQLKKIIGEISYLNKEVANRLYKNN